MYYRRTAICCRIDITPLDEAIAAQVAEDAGFKHWFTDGKMQRYVKRVGAAYTVNFTIDPYNNGIFTLLMPSIQDLAGHKRANMAASVAFHVASMYAEKVGGVMVQDNLSIDCRGENKTYRLTVARYPEQPLKHSQLCYGFATMER